MTGRLLLNNQEISRVVLKKNVQLATVAAFMMSLLLVTVILSSLQSSAAAVTTMSILAIPYFSPTSSAWNTIYEQADAYPGTVKYAIINPCSGPCSEPLSQDWQNVVSTLKSKGVKTLGYIYYTKESTANIDYYMKDPEIKTDGIFFDKEGSKDNLANFQKYADYVHSLGGVVYINPGYNYPPVVKYLNSGAADVANIYEAGRARINQMSVPDVPSSKLSAIVKNVFSSSDMQSAVSAVAAKNVGNVYVTARSYTSLPSYFVEEVKTASITTVP